MKYGQINEELFSKVLVFRYKRKSGKILEWSRLGVLAIRVAEIGAILQQYEVLETNTLNFSIRQCSRRLCFPLFSPNKEIF